MDNTQILDVAIVGYGPVGQTLSILLGQKGYTVATFDRWPTLYPLPRAVFHDHEIRRMFHAMGIGDKVASISQPSAMYQWFNADWKTLVEIDWSAESISGGPVGYLFNQPALEALLDHEARSLPHVQVSQGWEATSLTQHPDHVELTLRHGTLENGKWAPDGETQTVRARYVIGADGANSFVRKSIGVPFDDLGFQEDWLVIDLKPNAGITLDVPDIAQWCNPARPTTMVPGGPGYRRWEFMRLPHETLDELQKTDKVWELLEPWVSPTDATLVRHAVYTFRSLIAQTWRRDRVLLAGDAAHLMPPFMGQGMCSGLRDAWNLAWRLDLVLKGITDPDLLESYTQERRPQVRAVIDASIAMGRVVCIADAKKALERDAAYLAGNVPPLPPFPGLTDGIICAEGSFAANGLAGTLSLHGDVSLADRTMRYDAAVPNVFQLIALDANPGDYLDAQSRDVLERIGARLVRMDTMQGNLTGLTDVTGKYRDFFAANDVRAILVRPDYYIFGAVADLNDLPALVAELNNRIALCESPVNKTMQTVMAAA